MVFYIATVRKPDSVRLQEWVLLAFATGQRNHHPSRSIMSFAAYTCHKIVAWDLGEVGDNLGHSHILPVDGNILPIPEFIPKRLSPCSSS